MMNVVLLHPPSASDKSQMLYPPLGLASLASKLLMQNGAAVSIIDANVHALPPKQLVRIILQSSPDILGVSVCSNQYPYVCELLRIMKKINRRVVCVLGGPHPTAEPEQTLKTSLADYVILGEGEATFQALVHHISKSSKEDVTSAGIAYVNKDGRVTVNPRSLAGDDIDSLAFPARHLLDNNFYYCREYRNWTYIMTARGCPHNCYFCGNQSMWLQQYRPRAVTNVIEEIRGLVNVHNIHSLTIGDSDFLIDHARVQTFCQELLSKKIDIKWTCLARADSITKGGRNAAQTLTLMRQSGCNLIALGIESGSQRILHEMNKNLDVSEVAAAAKLIRICQIGIAAFYMFGYPSESTHDARETIALARRVNAEHSDFFYVQALPGTELYKKSFCLNHLLTDPSKYRVFHKIGPNISDMPDRELKGILKRAYLITALQPSHIGQSLQFCLREDTMRRLINKGEGLWHTLLRAIRPK